MTSRLLSLVLFALAHTTGASGQVRVAGTEPSSRVTITLPSPYLAGYAADERGEVLTYHSPIPTVQTSLLVRSEARERSIAWVSAPVPVGRRDPDVTFVLMVGIDVNPAPRAFDLVVAQRDTLRLKNPLAVEVGDTLRWTGALGTRGAFHVTLIDRYGDAMGFLFLTVPRALWEPGRPVRFETLGESAGERTWFMVFREALAPSVRLQNAPAILRTERGETQVLRLDVVDLQEGRRFVLGSPVGSMDTRTTMGHVRLSIPVPLVAGPTPVPIRFALGEVRDSLTYTVTPPRRMELHLLHHSHVDIGYTHHQDEVERMHWAFLEEALRLGEASAGYPEGERFVWNQESTWPIDTYLRAHPGEKSERLLEGIRRGWIEPSGMYANLLTGIATEEGLVRSLDVARALRERTGVPIESQLLTDIPGFTWGLAHTLATNGIRYLSLGPNFGHRIGTFSEHLADRPFWWEGPTPGERVLTWVSGGGYATFHTGLGYDRITSRLDEEKIFAYLDRLEAEGYPYDLTYLRYNIGSDNGPPDPGLADAVRAWNERYASPVLRISGATETFREFEDRYGPSLPVRAGDLTGYWEDGAGSSARETALARRAAESLSQTEALAEMFGRELPADKLEEAWRNVLLFLEHTWGSWNSISEPSAELTVTSWKRKQEFAERASALADALRASALAADTGARAESGSSTIEVINTLPWERTDVVLVPVELSSGIVGVHGGNGVEVPVQRLSTGELAVLVEGIAPRSTRRLRVERGEPAPSRTDPTPGPAAAGEPIELITDAYHAGLDAAAGTIRSLVHRPTGRELVRSDSPGLNAYWYVPGRDPRAAVGPGSGSAAWKERGPLVWSVEITAPAPGTRAPLARVVRLFRGVDRVDIEDRIAKSWVLAPEAVLFEFPFAAEDPEVRIDVPFADIRVERDQIPGSGKNYFSAQRWVDVSDERGGVTLTTLDAPLIQLGRIRTDAVVTGWLDRAEESATVYSYVMNNYWETNYRAAQDDEVTFRYSIRGHGAFDAAQAERFGREAAAPLLVRAAR